VRAKLVSYTFRPTATSSAELGRIQKADSDQWGPVVKASGFVAD